MAGDTLGRADVEALEGFATVQAGERPDAFVEAARRVLTARRRDRRCFGRSQQRQGWRTGRRGRSGLVLAQEDVGVAGLKPWGLNAVYLDAVRTATLHPAGGNRGDASPRCCLRDPHYPPGRRFGRAFLRLPPLFAIIVVAAGLTIARAVFSPLHRGAWIALAAAVSSYATAEFIWLFLYSSSDSPPYPSIADTLYLGFYPASYIGLLLLLPRPPAIVDARGLGRRPAGGPRGSGDRQRGTHRSRARVDRRPGVRGGDEHGVPARRRDPPLPRLRRLTLAPAGIPAAPGPSSEPRSRSALSPTARTSI